MQLAAAAYEANKDTPNAVKILHQAVVKDPRNVALYVDFANLAMTHQSFQTGIEMINAGLRLQPEAADLYLARGVLYVQLADYDRAEATLRSRTPRSGSGSAARRRNGCGRRRIKRSDKAWRLHAQNLASFLGRVSLVSAGGFSRKRLQNREC